MAQMMSMATTSASRCSSSSTMNGAPLINSSVSARRMAPASRTPLLVTCSSNNKATSPPSLTSLQESVDRATKQELSRADIERHQAETASEKQSIVGSRPASTVPWPRPEIERRPETGDRSLASLFAVDGVAPETINGRMAMVGFVWALVAEKLTGLSVMEQLFNPSTSGLLWFGAVVQLFTLASIIPFANGESTDARRWGPFTAKAERWNGRLAMLGFAALVVDEMVRQAPFLHQ